MSKRSKGLKYVRFRLSISAQAYESFYRGEAKYVQVETDNALKVNMPADIFRPFLTHTGISGAFEVVYDKDNRFQSIKPLG